jgi:hypothetical protein
MVTRLRQAETLVNTVATEYHLKVDPIHNAEIVLITVMLGLDFEAQATVDPEDLLPDLPAWKSWLLEAKQAWVEAGNRVNEDVSQSDPDRWKQLEDRLKAIDLAIPTTTAQAIRVRRCGPLPGKATLSKRRSADATGPDWSRRHSTPARRLSRSGGSPIQPG